MSKLEELVQQLCPDGVEFRSLKECCVLQKGLTPIQKAIPGEYPLVVTTTERKSSNTFQFTRPTVCVPLISSRGHGVASINQLYYQEGKFALGNILCGITPLDDSKLSARFLYYYLNHKKDVLIVPLMRGGANVSLTVDALSRIKVPVPPLDVQIEIVRIFDVFSDLLTQLTAELTARKKQYEYYRDSLLTFGDDVIWKPLGSEFPTIRNGFVGVVTSYFSNKEQGVRYLEGRDIHNGTISDDKAVYVTQEFHQKHLKTCLKPDDILVVQSGHVGECAVVGDKYAGANCHALIVMSNGGRCDSKYVAYYLQSTHGKKALASITTGGTVKHILASKIKKIQVPFPSLEEQRRIVSILDRFDALCNDLTSGLPAEIEARQKQYKYYRDKLLTFKEASV